MTMSRWSADPVFAAYSKRINWSVSRGGSILALEGVQNHKQNFPLLRRFDASGKICQKYYVGFSLRRLRPAASPTPATKRHCAELKTLGELTKIAWQHDVTGNERRTWTCVD